MKILLGCEESQAVMKELRLLGHEAYSCDLLECSGGYPEYHFKADVFNIIKGVPGSYWITEAGTKVNVCEWDIIISFPPCTHLTLSGARHFESKRKSGVQEEGLRFFFEIWKMSDAVENPMGIINGGKYILEHFPDLHKEMTGYGFPFKPSQVIQPYQFGHEAQKTTCLWLNGLPELIPTNIVGKGQFYTTPTGKLMPSWSHDAVGENGKKIGYNTAEIKKLRSKTFPGIAKAMAEQWTK